MNTLTTSIKKVIGISLILLTTLSLSCVRKRMIYEKKKVRPISYSVVNYKNDFFKEEYIKKFNSLLGEKVLTYFQSDKINDLPKTIYSPYDQTHSIEPLFINLENFNGVYTKMIWGNPRSITYNCHGVRGHFHYAFIIANDSYFDLSRDTTVNENLIRTLLNTDFTLPEIDSIVTIFKYGDLCDSYTHFPPLLIKEGDEILYNAYSD